jgi:hypothetical protein
MAISGVAQNVVGNMGYSLKDVPLGLNVVIKKGEIEATTSMTN